MGNGQRYKVVGGRWLSAKQWLRHYVTVGTLDAQETLFRLLEKIDDKDIEDIFSWEMGEDGFVKGETK